MIFSFFTIIIVENVFASIIFFFKIVIFQKLTISRRIDILNKLFRFKNKRVFVVIWSIWNLTVFIEFFVWKRKQKSFLSLNNLRLFLIRFVNFFIVFSIIFEIKIEILIFKKRLIFEFERKFVKFTKIDTKSNFAFIFELFKKNRNKNNFFRWIYVFCQFRSNGVVNSN